MTNERRILRVREVIRVTGLARSTIYYLMDIGLFPKPKRIGKRCVGWDSYDVDQWLNNLPETKTKGE